MTEPRYVYDGNIDKLAHEVEKLNRRAAKLGVPAIQLHIGEREVCFTCAKSKDPKAPMVSLDPKAWGPDAKPQGHERATVVIAGEPPMLAGWRFAAVVDHLSNGTITRYPFGGTEIDLTPYRGAEATCDHCATARKRHETFIVVHDDGPEKRVGRSCLKDFLGHSDPSKVIGHLNLYGKAFALLEGFEEAGFDTGVTYLDLPVFLGYVAAFISKAGWLSRGRAYTDGGVATADMAQSAYWSNLNPPMIVPTGADEARGKAALDWARALTDAEIGDNDYLYNLRAVCTDDFVRPKRGGLAGSVIVAAERAFEKAREIAENALKSNLHMGTIGERETFELTLKGTREIDGFYGLSTLHKFEDAAGNAFTWFATNPEIIPEGTGKREIAIGETHTLNGTVKKHDDFKGRNQTGLSRVAVPPKKKARKPKKVA
jgi:hypothetical protein